jgi:hypothetical protein
MLVVLSTAACTSEETEGPVDIVVTEVDTLVSMYDEFSARPSDLAVDEAGHLFILDGQLSHFIVISDAWDEPVIFGSEGGGPGEFSRPSVFAVADDTLRVVDEGNGRIQIMRLGEGYVRSYPIPAGFIGGTFIAGDGRMAVTTQGFSETLALTFDAEGTPLDSIGRSPAPPAQMWDMAAIKGEIDRGNVPSQLRNLTLPVLDSDRGLWIVLLGEGALRRYDSLGQLVLEQPLDAPELAQIREDFFLRNSEIEGSSGFIPLFYVADAVPAGQTIWLLLNTGEGAPSVILVIGRDGRQMARISFPSVSEASSLAVSPDLGRVYLAVRADATVLAADLDL